MVLAIQRCDVGKRACERGPTVMCSFHFTMFFLAAAIACLVLASTATAESAGASPVAVRAEMLTVTPATGPVTHLLVKNISGRKLDGQLAVQFPKDWKVTPSAQAIHLEADQTASLPFAIEKGFNSPDNSYPLLMEISSGQGASWTFRQTIMVATAPYLDIQVDGQIDDWKDSIPVTFTTGGMKTIVRTAYTRRKFFLLVGVEQKSHRVLAAQAPGPFDAIQIAMAPRDVVTPASPGQPSGRFEFLLADGAEGEAKCFGLTRSGETLPTDPVALEGREMSAAKVVVVRREGVTWYEASIPMKSLAGIEPEPGREFCFSLLVHDAEGAGLRDWGQAAGLWPSQRNRNAWVRWAGSRWPDEPPFDSAIEWGFCSSAQ